MWVAPWIKTVYLCLGTNSMLNKFILAINEFKRWTYSISSYRMQPNGAKSQGTIRPLSVYSPAVLVGWYLWAGSCEMIELSEDGILQFSSCLPLSHGHGDAWRSAQDKWQMKGNAQFISGASVVTALPIMRLQLASISYLNCTETLYHRFFYLFG